jgi:hypothetical protein
MSGTKESSALAIVVLDRLLTATTEFDFGAFIFGADDTALVRGNRYLVARDNVVLELGMFAGRLGRDRSFIIVQRTVEELRLPSDLSGIAPAQFEWYQSEFGNYALLHAALGPVTQKFRAAMQIRGVSDSPLTPLSAGMIFLALCLSERTHSVFELGQRFQDFQNASRRVASVDAAAYAGKAAKYGCQCLQALGIAEPGGGDEYMLTDVGRDLLAHEKLRNRFPNAFEIHQMLVSRRP